jgi:hypothetical protein
MSWTHYFDEDTAIKYGVPGAIIIEHLRYWIRKNKTEGSNFHDGHCWTFNTVKAWSILLPFWTEKQTAYVLAKLIEQKVIITSNYNKIGYDRTLWYAFENESEWIPEKEKIHSTNLENGKPKIVEPIPSSLPSSLPASLPTAYPKPIKRSKAAQKALKKASEVREITDYYQRLFVDEYHVKPTWDGKIMKLVNADYSRMGADLLGELIQLFFEEPGTFVKKQATGMGYNIFHSQIDSLLERRARSGKTG